MTRSALLLAVLTLSACTSHWTRSDGDQALLDRDASYCNALLRNGGGPAPTATPVQPAGVRFHRDGFSALSVDPALDQCLMDEGWTKTN